MAPDYAESEVARIVRLETKLDFIIAQLDKLPPSPLCVAHHAETNKRLASLEGWRNRAIGVIMVVNIILIAVMEKILSFFGVK